MNLLAQFWTVLKEKGYSRSIRCKILEITAFSKNIQENREQALTKATNLVKKSKTEQEALELIQAEFPKA